MLKIGFDAKRAFLNTTGLGNYSRSIIRSLSLDFPKNEYFLFSPEIKKNLYAEFQNLPNTSMQLAPFPFFKSLWRSKYIIKDLKKKQLDLYHGLSNELPVGIENSGICSVVTIHDLIFLRYPQFYKSVDRKIYFQKFKYACEHAHHIIAVSEQTKKDVVSFFKIPEKKISVIYQSCAPEFGIQATPIELETISKKYHLPPRFILNVGTIEERKNLLLLAQTMRQLPKEIPLVIIGRPTPYLKKVKEYIVFNKIEDQFIFLDDVSFIDLPKIYQLADLFVYPSRFEGFGIPILEALTAGVPVLATTGSCLEEAGGPSSIYVSPDHAIELSETIIHLWNDEQQKKEMIEKGKIYALQFKPQLIARAYMQLYQELIT